MAVFYPSLVQIQEMRTKPTDGEWRLLKFLEKYLQGRDDYEIFFQPHLEGYRPDIVIMRKGGGVLIIEVKDYNMLYYRIADSNNWYVRTLEGEYKAESPVEQVTQYKRVLFNLFAPELAGQVLSDNNNWAVVSRAVFLSEASGNEIAYAERNCRDFLNSPYCSIFGKEQLNEYFFSNFFYRCWLSRQSRYFSEEMYNELKDLFYPSDLMLQAKEHYNIKLAADKKKYIISQANYRGKIRGVAGSGKTMLLAARAYEAAKRLSDTDEPVVILTFNITLRNYIRDRIMSLLPAEMSGRRRFLQDKFIILHYHAFIMMYRKMYLSHLGPVSDATSEDYFILSELEKYPRKYKAIFVDEVQDYKKEWIDSIWRLLAPDGEIMFLADEKQSIYENNVLIINEEKKKRVYTGIPGAWKKLADTTFRLRDRITDLANAFQQYVFQGKYEVEPLAPQQLSLFEDGSRGEISYHYLEKFDLAAVLEIYDDFIAEQRDRDIHINVNDICFLGEKIEDLRLIDQAFRESRNRFTCTIFETEKEYEAVKKKLGFVLSKEELDEKLRPFRRTKRFTFNMESGGLKISTIHSFKGWEVRVVFLLFGDSCELPGDILPEEDISKIDYKDMKNELLYTGLTRAKEYLILINIGNQKYDAFFRWYMAERYDGLDI